jgi:hypothetical protein
MQLRYWAQQASQPMKFSSSARRCTSSCRSNRFSTPVRFRRLNQWTRLRLDRLYNSKLVPRRAPRIATISRMSGQSLITMAQTGTAELPGLIRCSTRSRSGQMGAKPRLQGQLDRAWGLRRQTTNESARWWASCRLRKQQDIQMATKLGPCQR